MSVEQVQDELADYAQLLVDEAVARTIEQLERGEGLSIDDQKHALAQLVTDRKRLEKAKSELALLRSSASRDEVLNENGWHLPSINEGLRIARECNAPTVREDALEEAIAIAAKHAQRARDAVAECRDWSPAQAEWSRARDLGEDIADELRNLKRPEGERGG